VLTLLLDASNMGKSVVVNNGGLNNRRPTYGPQQPDIFLFIIIAS
jgi:hypothetical protein